MLYGLPCGISPHNLFALKFACLSVAIPSKLSGIFPVMALMDKSNHCSLTSCPKLVGIEPVIWFLLMSNLSSFSRSMYSKNLLVLLLSIPERDPESWLDILSKKFDSPPVKALSDRSMELKESGLERSIDSREGRPLALEKEAGKGLESMFLDKLRFHKFGRAAMESGICPVNRLKLNDSPLSDFNLPICGGILPLS
nr:hypothetical protein AQUCO_03500041v1 [Ipomoea batatas]GMD36159.1 hypothetical protein AQUCO_03500041v1 [Ipomoea batatas]